MHKASKYGSTYLMELLISGGARLEAGDENGWNALHKAARAGFPDAVELLSRTDQVQVIDANVHTGFLGHSYFITNPAVLSDLILILRDNKRPGPENGRPLNRKDGGFWTITDSYLVPPRTASTGTQN